MKFIYRVQSNGNKVYYHGINAAMNLIHWSNDQLSLVPATQVDDLIKKIKLYSHFNHQMLVVADFNESNPVGYVQTVMDPAIQQALRIK